MSEEYVELNYVCDFSSELSQPDYFPISTKPTWSVLQRGLGYTDQIVEHELGIVGNRIYWRKGVDASRRPPTIYFSLDTQIQHALICRFPKHIFEENLRHHLSCLCVVESCRITAFSEDEDIFNIALPFPLKAVWSSAFGLILQRDPSEQERNAFYSKDSIDQTMDDSFFLAELPVLFTLTHPLNEPSHILYKYSDYPSSFVNYFCNPLIDVVHVNINPSYVILYDSILQQHSIWLMKPASPKPSQNISHSLNDHLLHSEQPMSSSAPPRVQHFEVTPFNSPLKLYTPSPSSKNFPSNPDYISTPFFSGGSLKSLSSVDVSTSKRKDSLRVATVKRNFSQVMFDFSSNCDVKTKFSKILGPKPLIGTNKQNSRLGPGNASIKRAKSLSPNSIPLPSPLSRSIPPKQFNPKYLPFEDHTEPVYPEICLLNVYTQPNNLNRFRANKVFQYKDVLNREFIVFVDKEIGEVWLLELFFRENGTMMEFGNSLYLDACDAVSIDALHFLLCLNNREHSLHLYSCNTHICKILCNFPQIPISLEDPISYRITIAFLNGSIKRYSIPSLSKNNTTSLMLSAFSQQLPKSVFHNLVLQAYIHNNSRHKSILSDFLNMILQFFGVKENLLFHVTTRNHILSILAKNRQFYLPTLRILILQDTTRSDPQHEIVHNAILQEHLCETFNSIHLILEEIMISPFASNEAILLTKFLSLFVILFDFPLNYLEYYNKLVPSMTLSTYRSTTVSISDSVPDPRSQDMQIPSLFYWLCNQLVYPLTGQPPFPYIPNVTSKTMIIICIYILIFLDSNTRNSVVTLESYLRNASSFHHSMDFHSSLIVDFNSLFRLSNVQEMVITFLMKRKIAKTFFFNICSAYSIPIINLLDSSKLDPPKNLPGLSYMLLDRADFAFHNKGYPLSYSESFYLPKPMNSQFGLVNLLFPEDNRVFEVCNLLNSSKYIPIDIGQCSNLSDEDFLELQSSRLLKLSTRSLALPIGRGMYNYGSLNVLNTDVICIPELNISGKTLATNSTVTIDSLGKPFHLTFWPEFHNGVASGLALHPFSKHIDSSWIQFNRPILDRPNEYAGFLMAMGLQGHLSSLSKFTMHDLLSRGHELTLVGILIGISAAKRASMDPDITRMLSIHVRSLQPESSMELEISPNVQTAAILSVGLIYQGTSNRHIVDVLMNEIERFSSCEMENIFDRRCRCLSSGFALGLTLLGSAKGGARSAWREITEKLTNNVKGCSPNIDFDNSVKSQQISDEGIDIMSLGPGSLMALSMIYLKSNDQSISNFLKPENSYFLLDETHPYILLLRTISYCIVQWDNIQPTQEWVNSIIPKILTDGILRSKNDLIQDGMELDVVRAIHSQILVGCLYSLGLRFAGSQNILAYDFIYCYLLEFIQDKSCAVFLSDTRINCALLACSLVVCGSGDSKLLKIIYELRQISTVDNDFLVGYGNQMAYHIALGFACLGNFQYSIRTSDDSIAYLLISLYPVFQNSSLKDIYHLQAFRHIYALALERRFLHVKDIYTNQSCTAHAIIKYTSFGIDYSKRIRIPYLVPETHRIYSITIHSDEYWPIQLDDNIGYFSDLYSEGGLIYLLKRSFFWESFPNGYSRTVLFDYYQSCFNSMIRIQYNPILFKLCLYQFDSIKKYIPIELIGHNNTIILDRIMCIISYFDFLSNNLQGNTLRSQQFVFLYYFYQKRKHVIRKIYLQEFVGSMDRKLHLTLRNTNNRLTEFTESHHHTLYLDREYILECIYGHKYWYYHLHH
ncbi:Anaphase-promoting complex subunit 1 [Oopsacas minuta]|uniref:Anaphase-promoting complex subunit 1 n=1 Tax=Oopsacas minuta TaxID=111878 RepID=A0AAV7JJD1_9METZ|nr:Anaphase-promoting complex subunit 1 [Oopsacas minuta]